MSTIRSIQRENVFNVF